MNLLQKIEYWGEHHHPKWLDILRIVLGIFLIYKGIDFLIHMGDMVGLLTTNQDMFGSFKVIVLAHIIVFAHIVGGALIAVGFLTRLACLIQIPILLGAILFVNLSGDLFRPYSEIILSILVLLLLIYFLIVGNGPLSYEKMSAKEEKDYLHREG
jgi:uncharacterized membrane protein YphA (DoxX/SURF4 family)